MPREKKSKVDDITVLRRILDNPTDPQTKQLFSENEKAFHSIYYRLRGENVPLPKKTSRPRYGYNSLEPRVTIRTNIPSRIQTVTPLKSFQPINYQEAPVPSTTTLPKFELVSPSEPVPSIPQVDYLFASEDLYEIERIGLTGSENPQVTLAQPTQESQEPSAPPSESLTVDKSLPEWQPVEDTRVGEPQEKPGAKNIHEPQQIDSATETTTTMSSSEAIPEFERMGTPTPEPQEQAEYWKAPSVEGQPKETTVEFQPVESPEPSFQELTRKQKREARKAEKLKEKEEKKRKKLEMKKSKVETHEKGQEVQMFEPEQQSLQPPTNQQPEQVEPQEQPSPETTKAEITSFSGIESIDEKTAGLLLNNGYFTLENLREASVDDLARIRGIKRKLAKQIKSEVQQKTLTSPIPEFIPIKGKTSKKSVKQKSDDFSEWESYHKDDSRDTAALTDAFVYKNYTLYKKITKQGKRKTTIHFFSKEKPEIGEPVPLPKGFQVAVNRKTKIPYLKKKK